MIIPSIENIIVTIAEIIAIKFGIMLENVSCLFINIPTTESTNIPNSNIVQRKTDLVKNFIFQY